VRALGFLFALGLFVVRVSCDFRRGERQQVSVTAWQLGAASDSRCFDLLIGDSRPASRSFCFLSGSISIVPQLDLIVFSI